MTGSGTDFGLHRLTTPRAAALAGVLFAVLFGTALVLIRIAISEDTEPGSQWISTDSGQVRLAASLIPFAGIAFLWFIGVVRDGFGRYEDKFFSTVFLGSGILFLATTFVWTSVGVSLIGIYGIGAAEPDSEVAIFGRLLLTTLSQTYALRMAAVFMISLATIWLRTGLMPRWLVAVSYAVAMTLLISSEISMWITLAFPLWVLLVSVLLLVRAGVIPLHRDEQSP